MASPAHEPDGPSPAGVAAARLRAEPAAPADLAAEIRRLADLVAGHESRLARLEAAVAALQRRDDEIESALDEARAALEPARLVAHGGLSAADIDRQAGYAALVARLRRVVRERLPRDARVLVIGRGDEDLVNLSGRRAAHFPQDAAGDFAGEYPADCAAAVADLERLVGQGFDHLVIPATSAWWLESYPALAVHLHRDWQAIHRDPETCLIFARDPAGRGPWRAADDFIGHVRRTEGRLPAILDWETGADLAAFFPGCAVFPPVERGVDRLPYIERSIDVVAVAAADQARLVEARRIASAAVMTVALPGVMGPGFTVGVQPVAAPGGGAAGGSSGSVGGAGGPGLIVPQVRP